LQDALEEGQRAARQFGKLFGQKRMMMCVSCVELLFGNLSEYQISQLWRASRVTTVTGVRLSRVVAYSRPSRDMQVT
jgi:hypothetical protein